MTFWLIIGAVTLAVLFLMAQRMQRPGASPNPDMADTGLSSDMKVYRVQLKELERDLERGTITADEAERTRIEVSRRLLDADKAAAARATPTQAPQAATRITLALCAVLVACGSFGIYWMLGAPGYQDLGRQKRIELSRELRENRPSQAEAEAAMPPWPGPPPEAPADYLELIQGLRDAVAKRPGELRGLDLLAQHEAALGNMIAARKAMAQLIAAKGTNATADDYVRHADLMLNATGGFISPEAETMLTRALELEPRHQLARYYTGLLFAQNGRPDMGFRLWRGLLEEGPATAIWWTSVRSQIGDLAAHAGVDYTPPNAPTRPPMAGLSGPSAQDIEAAQDMTQQDRAEMIQGMVDRLSDRLATQGGTPQEWARLISVLGVTGDTERAAAIWAEAQSVFAGNTDALATINNAAKQAGIAQ